MIHDRFCQLGTDKDFTSPEQCWSCDWVQRIRDDERSRAGIIGLAYAAALDAAREAVAALDTGRDVRFSADVQADALAAIDALRGEPNG